MNHRPYPNAGRALRQLDRHAHKVPAATPVPMTAGLALARIAEGLRSLPKPTLPGLRLVPSEETRTAPR